MAKWKRNEGIIVSGSGKIEADQLAVGRQAQNIKTINNFADSAGNDDLATKLRELAEAIQAHLEDEQQRTETLEALASLTEELEKDKPNQLVGSALLEGLEKSVGHITNIALKLAPFVAAAKVTLGF